MKIDLNLFVDCGKEYGEKFSQSVLSTIWHSEPKDDISQSFRESLVKAGIAVCSEHGISGNFRDYVVETIQNWLMDPFMQTSRKDF